MHARVGGNVKMIYLHYNCIKNAVENFKSSIFHNESDIKVYNLPLVVLPTHLLAKTFSS